MTTKHKGTLLCIVTGEETYGVRQVWTDLFTGLSQQGWTIVVAVLEAHRADEWKHAYPDLRIVPARHASQTIAMMPGTWSKILSVAKRVLHQLQHVQWLTQLVNEIDAKVLLLQSPPETVLAGLVARRCNLRALWLVPNAIGSGHPFDINRRAYRATFRFGNVVPVSNSHYTDSTFGPGNYERHVVHLGVDTTYYQPGGEATAVRCAFGIPEDAPLIGLFARMDPSKGQDRLIEALAISNTPFHLLLCGGPIVGPYADQVRSKITQHGLCDRVHVAGPQSDLRPYYAACDIITNLRVDAEPFGLTVIEAMACGKPVFAHGLGGPAETVVDGETGWLLPDVEVETLSKALMHVLSDRAHWRKFGVTGRARVESYFHREKFSREVDLLTNIRSF